MRSVCGVVVGVILGVLGAAPAWGQCAAGWVTGPGSLGISSSGRAMARMRDGKIVVGGDFATVTIPAPNRLAFYDPNTGVWTAPATGTNPSLVHALAALSNGDVLVGGNFLSIGGISASRIARYRPSTDTWTALGLGVSGQVNSILVLPSGDYLVGGNITLAGGGTVQHIARFNPTTGVWSGINSMFTSTGDNVSGLALAPDGTAIVGGIFFNAGGSGALRIARYNPVSGAWSPLGSGVNNAVRDVAVLSNGDVIAVGDFTLAGGVPVGRVAHYHVSTGTWTNMAGGVSGGFNYVNSVVVLPGDDVVVGGSFTVAGGVGAARVARYNMTTGVWTPMGSGVNNDINAMVTMGTGDVMVTGVFTSAGGVGAARLARYRFGGASNAGIDDQPHSAQVCEGSDAALALIPSGEGPLTYRWQRESPPGTWTDLVDGLLPGVGTVSGAWTPALTLGGATVGASGAYRCVVANVCTLVTSDPAVLTVLGAGDPGCGSPACDPDVNQDGNVDQDDVVYLINVVGGGDNPSGIDPDFNHDGNVDQDDVLALIDVVAGAACP